MANPPEGSGGWYTGGAYGNPNTGARSSSAGKPYRTPGESFAQGSSDAAGDLWGGVKKGANWLSDQFNPYNEFHAGVERPDPRIQQQVTQWALTGQGPSAAQDMLRKERANNIAAAQSMAKSSPGLGISGQQRLASMGASKSIAEASNKAAVLRAQEQQQAMQNYADLYRTQAQAYADAMRANAQVAAENASAKRGIIGGVVKGAAGILGL
jgi:hypothetical protein